MGGDTPHPGKGLCPLHPLREYSYPVKGIAGLLELPVEWLHMIENTGCI
jgi:hypothetical protein